MMLMAMRDSLLLALRHAALRRLALAFAASVALCLLAALAFWYPAWRQGDALRAQVSEQEAAIKARRLARSENQAALQARGRLAQIDERLSRPVGQARLMNAINTLAQQHKLKLVEQKSDQNGAAIVGAEDYTVTRHELLLSGRYPDMRAWLHGLRELPGFVIVRHFHMERDKRGKGVRMTVKFDTIGRLGGGGQPV